MIGKLIAVIEARSIYIDIGKQSKDEGLIEEICEGIKDSKLAAYITWQ